MKSASMPGRRSFLHSVLAAGAAPWFVPAHVLRGATAPSNKMTLGVIGCGAQGTGDLRAFLNHADVRVTRLCDVNTKNLGNAQKFIIDAYGSNDVKTYHDFRELNRDPTVDAVLMALPVHWHSIPAADAILNGKHIYHEKPMGMSIEEAKHVRAAVKKKGVVFQFGTQQRSDMKFRWACELARNGRLGRLKEIQVGVEGGIEVETFREEKVPEGLDWDRWVGPAPMTPFSGRRISRRFHENISNFSLGMVSCWGIHHLDIANWGNGTDDTGPVSVEGTGAFPKSGSCDAVLSWRIRYEFAKGAPIVFANQSQDPKEIGHGVRFIGEDGWVHVVRGQIKAGDEAILRDPHNKVGEMPVVLDPEVLGCCGGKKDPDKRVSGSDDHTRKFVDAVLSGTRSNCDIDTSVRSDALCQLAAIVIKENRKLKWDPEGETFIGDERAAARMKARTFRGDWKLPEIG
ncbi:MAG: Gfo/Idh/MocA family oxidoreductase [Verrucomicrobiaceae bacterium]|nr:Gfo/Idh/MocA family oxidoreductase [Verrucomicrobiaceae bacterium]